MRKRLVVAGILRESAEILGEGKDFTLLTAAEDWVKDGRIGMGVKPLECAMNSAFRALPLSLSVVFLFVVLAAFPPTLFGQAVFGRDRKSVV